MAAHPTTDLRSGCTLVTDQYWPLALPVDMLIEVKGVKVRIRQTWDLDAIRLVLNAALQRSLEADLVEALYHNGHLHLSLSAEVEERKGSLLPRVYPVMPSLS
jgi:hypothetical protein